MNKKNRNNSDKFHGADRAFAESVAQRTGAIVRETLLPEGKISDILCEYAQPLVEEFAETDQDHIDVLHLASGLWNMALMKTMDRGLYAEMESALMPILANPPYWLAPDSGLNVISLMMNRWTAEFSWCSRIIVDKHITMEGTKLHLSVVTAPLPRLGTDAPAELDREPGVV
jgi:hypothetical protein